MVTLFANEEKKSLSSPSTQEAEIVPKPLVPLSPFTEAFLQNQESLSRSFQGGAEATIKVSEVLGSIAHLYEKIRNIVEYKGEHVLRRNAIERILKRLLWEHAGHDTERIAQTLLRELIWARYLPNDSIPKSKLKQIAKIINKYLYLLGKLIERGTSISETNLRAWVWGVASCEIEEALDPSNREPYVELMYEWFKTYFEWRSEIHSEHERDVQIYLSIHRSLAKADEEIMRYHLLLKEYPGWNSANLEITDALAHNFFRVYEEIEKHLNFPDKFRLYRLMQKHTAPFEVLRQMVKEEPTVRTLIQDNEKFEWKIREICQKRYAQIQRKVNRGIVRSIIYIFVTKVVFALLIEVPYELYKFGMLTVVPLSINVVVPPGMMWLLGLTIRAPGEDNTQRIITKLKTVVYRNPSPRPVPFSLSQAKRTSLLNLVFTFIYLILFIIVFGGITYILLRLHFTLVGMAVFFAFLSLVLLFGFRVRYTASELKVTTDKEGFFGYLFNNVTLPFLSTGVFLSRGLAKLNFFTVILDFLIEAPLKNIIEVIEEWTTFIREKREEVVEVPEQ